jgi:prepilin-type N-terminal cleavage/methylation domain-containing protein
VAGPFVSRSALRDSRSTGYSLVEMVVAVAIFGIFLVVLVGLQGEFLKHDREVRVALFTHPAPLAVMARIRRDVLDSRGYPESMGSWSQSPETLLLDAATDDGTPRVVVWDFRDPTIARRLELRQDGEQVAAWEARAVPHYKIDSWKAPDGRVGVLVTAKDNKGNVVVDQIVTPRAR